MKSSPAESFQKHLTPQLMEHFDAYVLIGYTADEHQKQVVVSPGRDPACQDGLRIVGAMANHWLIGKLFPPANPQEPRDSNNNQEPQP